MGQGWAPGRWAGLGPRGPGKGGDLAWILETSGFPQGQIQLGVATPSPQLRGGDQAQDLAYSRR